MLWKKAPLKNIFSGAFILLTVKYSVIVSNISHYKIATADFSTVAIMIAISCKS